MRQRAAPVLPQPQAQHPALVTAVNSPFAEVGGELGLGSRTVDVVLSVFSGEAFALQSQYFSYVRKG